jgi:hypothetical protein
MLDDLLQDFYDEVMPETDRKVREFLVNYDKVQAQFDCEDLVIKALHYMARYEYCQEMDDFQGKYLAGAMLKDCIDGIPSADRLDHELFPFRVKIKGIVDCWKVMVPDKVQYDQTDKERAKAYPFDQLMEFHRNMALCPWHEDKNPSLQFLPDINRVKCFSCDRLFDTIDYVMLSQNLEFKEAIKWLNKR